MAVSEKMRKALEQRKKDIAKKGDGSYSTISFKVGTHRIRVLPVGEEDFGIEATTFFLKDIGFLVSPRTFGDPCAICEMYDELKASKSEDDRDLAATFRPKKKYLIPIIKYKDEKGKEVELGPKLAQVANGVYNDLIDLMLDEENGDFTDPKEGYDVKIKRTGEGQLDTEYSVLVCKTTPLPKEFLKKVYNPEELAKEIAATYEETEEAIKKFLNLGGGKDDEDDAPPVRKKKKRPTAAEPAAPLRKKKKRPTSDI